MTTDAAGQVQQALETLRAELDDRIRRFDDTLVELRADRGAETADDEHDPEGATLSAEWSRLAGLRADAARERDEVDAALARTGTEGFGICADCGAPIPLARLVARPTATRCVPCATRAGA
ncbi:TraR/DksA family transcriptional regulator [Microbacterium sp. NPDC055910]|uniref:TraR/DksA family transcriptional regulator n=1 Tax=Microbacterium sp. NPDC055910 TaxID=3345659 RepID=UPI0035DCEC83